MYEGWTVGAVVPAYNEAGHVGEVVETVPDYVDRVYVVDDASTDGTWTEIRECARRCNERARATAPDGGTGEAVFTSPVVPIRHEENRGVGGAIKTGYLRAAADDVDVAVVLAGDGQMDPSLLDRLLDPVVSGRADYAKGNRLAGGDHDAMPRHRLVGNAVLSLLTKVASGYWHIGDPQNGYTAISGAALDAVDVAGMYEFYGYCNDLLVSLNVAGLRVADVPMPAVYGDEVSHIRYRSYVPRVSAMLLRNFCWRLGRRYLRSDFHPLVALYGLGTAGLAASVWRALRRRSEGDSLVAALVSAALLAVAMVLDREENRDVDVGLLDDE